MFGELLEIRGLKRPSCAACILAVFVGSAAAQVLDVDGGEYSTVTRTQSTFVTSVLDLDRPPPVEAEREAETETSEQTNIEVASLAARSPRRGTPQIEALIVDVALEHARHPGIRAAGLTTTEWVAYFRANIAIESNFRQAARSHVGAIGLGQLMPATARTLGVDPLDAKDNLRGSALYLLTQLQTFRSKELALAAYNAGPEAVTRYGGIPPYRETQGHVQKVLAIFHQTIGQETT